MKHTSALRLLLLACIIGIAGVLGYYFFPSPIPLSSGKASKCFMHGMITSEGANVKPAVSDMIRLHFDADNKAKCELMMRNYCLFNVKEKEYSPVRLKGVFKPDVNQEGAEFNYGFNAKCKLLTDDDD
jgi:hypothetical protein